ncbi:MAG: transporter [Acidimicrobiaceae bacterium]|nr:transporter [Acidimicrobiaceae bacterium]
MHSEVIKLALFGLLGLLSAVTANRTVAIYQDGLRTSVIELWAGVKTRRDLAAYSYKVSLGFVLVYALPYSLVTGIVMIHIICLGTDTIGLRIKNSVVAGLAGATYAIGASALVSSIFLGLRHLPPAIPNLHLIWAPLAYSLPLLGVATASEQRGFRAALYTFVLTMSVWALAAYGLHTFHDGILLGGVVALGVTMAVLVALALREKSSAPADLSFFEDKIARVRRNWLWLLPIGAVIAVLASQRWIGGEPIQVAMLSLHQNYLAAAVAIFSVFGYLPVQGMTGLVSGIWNQDGYPDWFLAVGFLVSNPIGAAVGGAALMGFELVSLRWVARLLTTRPGITSLGHATRGAMDVVPNLAVLAGGVTAASTTGGPAGALAVVGLYILNDKKGRPVVPLAVPVFAYLLVALAAGVAKHLGVPA